MKLVPAEHREEGSAIVEFALVSILLVMLLLMIMQLAVFLHIRNVAAASAAEGARYGANANSEPGMGSERANDLIGKAIGSSAANEIACEATQVDDPGSGLEVVRVRCSGDIPVFFAPFGDVLPINVTARSMREGQ